MRTVVATDPETKLDRRFSEPGTEAEAWSEGRRTLEAAELFWLATVRTDGRPHVTPLIGIWAGEAAYFCTGPEEQKAVNLAANPSCALLTGSNELHQGFDVVLEGTAERVGEPEELARIAAGYLAKYGEEWRFRVGDGVFEHGEGDEVHQALVFRIAPAKALGFSKDPYSHTSWRFSS